MSAAHAVTIVVLTYNRWQDTRECLASIYASDACDSNVIVVDNGSTDNTLKMLPREFPNVTLICNSDNAGYAEGNNIGIRAALEQNAEFALVLNNDVVVAKTWLTPLLDAMQKDVRAALAGPLVLHADEPRIIQSAGGVLPASWHAFHRAANEAFVGQFTQVEQVDWLSGCTILARSRAVREFGLLDAAFYMYGEDVDWCVRARKAGYHVLFVPESNVWHKGVQRNYTPPPHVTYYSARNELQLIRQHRGGTGALVRALLRDARTLTSWSLRPRWRAQRAHRDALARALRDFFRGARGRVARG